MADLSLHGLALGVAAALLAGCAAVGPDYQAPSAPQAEAVTSFPSATTDPRQVSTVTSEPPDAWWRQLGDPDLDFLVDQTLAANFDLEVAIANVESARAQLTQFETRRLPSLDLSGVVRERRDAQAVFPRADPHGDLPTRSVATATVDLLWEIDLFGRVRRSVEAASAEVGSLEAVRNNVLLAALSATASAYVDLRGAQARLAVAERNVSVQQQTLDLVVLLNREGAANDLDVARARSQLLASQATIPSLHAAARAALNRLTTLTAQAPGALDARLAPAKALPALPALVAVGAPADLLRRRPDILAAERALAASSARIGVATADLFPTVSLVGTAGVSASPVSKVTAAGAPLFSLGPQLRWNIFNREAIYARIAQADAAAAANLARYRATVTRALEEADSAIAAYGNERQRAQELTAAVEASRLAEQLAELRYKEGAEDFLTVLDAERSLLQLEDQQAVSSINVAQRLIDIQRALGGGWQTAAVPEAAPYVQDD
ncbi:MAG: efflux transporter outer membrane subunit [Gammaproteobacteria bacterium]